MQKVILYSTDCPRCKVLKAKLDEAGITYETVTDVEVMKSKGFRAAPVLQVGDTEYDFGKALDYIKNLSLIHI